MEIDFDIVTRALQKAGQEPLTQEDIEKNSTRYRTISAFYLSTILETLARTEWTSQKRRKKLRLSEEENLSEYAFRYELPLDCAKAEQLLNNKEFVIEGGSLYTDDEEAVLMYISNSCIDEVIEIDEDGNIYVDFGVEGEHEERLEIDEEYNLWWIGEHDECPYEVIDDMLYFIFSNVYKDYEGLEFDPLLEHFIETRLAAEIALKITGDMKVYQTLYNESLMIENEAEAGTKAQSRSRKNGSEWWADRLGLGGANAHY